MKREPKITLPIKKPAKVDKLEPQWRLWVWYFLLTMLVLWIWQELANQVEYRTIPYSEFRTYLAQGAVTEALVKQGEIDGRIVPKPEHETNNRPTQGATPAPSPAPTQSPSAETKPFFFRTERIEDPGLVNDLQTAGVRYAATRPGVISQLFLAWVLPIAVMVLLWNLLSRRMGGAGQSIFSIGKSRARLVADPDTGVTFEDVAGCEEAKFELVEVVNFLKNPKKYEEVGARIPKGVLLVGPPGTGKTLLARAVAGEAQVPFFLISGSDFVEMFVGVGAARVRDLFQQAKVHAPCIIFIDELDAIGRQRGVHVGAVNDEREQTLNALLVEMDGFEPNIGVILLAATNRPEVLDRALLRPGRFDRQVVVDTPDLGGREAILKVHSKDKQLASDVDLRRIAAATAGFSGADLANVLNEAALLTARRHGTQVAQADLEEAIEKVIAGPERKSRRLSDEDKRRVAYHEVGHALIAAYSHSADPVHKISIIPRGRAALGYTMQLPTEDQFLLTRTELMERIRGMLGGRAAEEVFFGEVSTGAQNDLERATALARQMVAMYGMSERVGLVSCAQRQPTFLSNLELQSQRDCSEQTTREIDEEVRGLLAQAYDEAKDVLSAHRDQVERLTAELIKHESMDGQTFYQLIGLERPAIPVAEPGAVAGEMPLKK
ncbi:MAG: ATP-dependent zinc metalloprotease FtsH [Verrucomicrobia bacterium]|nr:ATP-dependent zinc metalloprotease FtsH [Verrucomicrobiota bacterium]MBV9297363.1 ATP-dependent zinc metalloprotease FtsH [Verrucomicrobiota bacterium]MBV9644703.1 ATP-dependent zinc metalloprotease FtsH [Verrucomicrobiota bacterium]